MLRVDGVRAGYGSMQILNGVSLGVERGRIASLLGGNGTGKSTLLKTVSGLLKPSEGTVQFDGERIDGLRPDRIVQRGLVQVTQGKEAYPAMTVEENLRLGAYLIGNRGQLRRSSSAFTTISPAQRAAAALHDLSGRELQMPQLRTMSQPDDVARQPSAAPVPQVVLDVSERSAHLPQRATLLLVNRNGWHCSPSTPMSCATASSISGPGGIAD
jgi:branched-chain amino acid transport system ATP-binding protein